MTPKRVAQRFKMEEEDAQAADSGRFLSVWVLVSMEVPHRHAKWLRVAQPENWRDMRGSESLQVAGF